MENKIKNMISQVYDVSSSEEVSNLYYQFFIVGMKSMILSEEKIGAFYNEAKLRQELNLLREYITSIDSVRNILKHDDKSVFLLLLPSIMMNKDWQAIIDNTVIIFNVCALDYSRLIKFQLLASIISDFFIGKNIYLHDCISDEIIDDSKNKLIDISIRDSNVKLAYSISKIDLLKYEQSRITTIDLLNKRRINELTYLNLIDEYINLEMKFNDMTDDEKKRVDSFSKFIIKMRNGRLNPRLMKYDLQAKPTFKGYMTSNKFSHPIMGVCEIYKRDENMIYLKTKIGNIRMKIDEKK